MQEKRERFQEQIALMPPETVGKLVFIDESGVNTITLFCNTAGLWAERG